MNWGWGWATALLPDLERRSIHDSFNFNVPFLSADERTAIRTSLAVFSFPSAATGPVETHFGGISRSGPAQHFSASRYVVFTGAVARPRATKSSAIAGADLQGDGVFFYQMGISLREIGDGTSTTILVGERSRTIADAVLRGLSTRAGGEPITSGDI